MDLIASIDYILTLERLLKVNIQLARDQEQFMEASCVSIDVEFLLINILSSPMSNWHSLVTH